MFSELRWQKLECGVPPDSQPLYRPKTAQRFTQQWVVDIVRQALGLDSSVAINGKQYFVNRASIKRLYEENRALCMQLGISSPKDIAQVVHRLRKAQGSAPEKISKDDLYAQTKALLGALFPKKTPLPPSKIDESHIQALLMQRLGTKENVLILPFVYSAADSLPAVEIPQSVRYIVSFPGSKRHHTAFIIDKKEKKYYNIDSGGHWLAALVSPSKREVETTSHQFMRYGYITDEYKQALIPCRTQIGLWECGYHVVDNIVNFVETGSLPTGWIRGSHLKAKYERDFNAFLINCHVEKKLFQAVTEDAPVDIDIQESDLIDLDTTITSDLPPEKIPPKKLYKEALQDLDTIYNKKGEGEGALQLGSKVLGFPLITMRNLASKAVRRNYFPKFFWRFLNNKLGPISPYESIYSTIQSIERLNHHLKEIQQRLLTNNNPTKFFQQKTGLIFHAMLNDKKALAKTIEEMVEMFATQYRKAKKENRLKEFFEEGLPPDEICFEAKYRALSDYALKVDAQKSGFDPNLTPDYTTSSSFARVIGEELRVYMYKTKKDDVTLDEFKEYLLTEREILTIKARPENSSECRTMTPDELDRELKVLQDAYLLKE